jgi:hypothetical protein
MRVLESLTPALTYLNVVAVYNIYPPVVWRTPLGFPVEPLNQNKRVTTHHIICNRTGWIFCLLLFLCFKLLLLLLLWFKLYTLQMLLPCVKHEQRIFSIHPFWFTRSFSALHCFMPPNIHAIVPVYLNTTLFIAFSRPTHIQPVTQAPQTASKLNIKCAGQLFSIF